jgi:hypothetical protein
MAAWGRQEIWRRAADGCTTGGGPTSGGGAPALVAVREEGPAPRGEGSVTTLEGRRRCGDWGRRADNEYGAEGDREWRWRRARGVTRVGLGFLL